MKITKYRNKFYNKSNQYSVEYRTPTEEPITEYKGYYIFKGTTFVLDIVTDVDGEWLCISQVGSIRYAKAFIDNGCVHGDYRECK